MAVGQNQWYHLGVGAPPILEPILVGIGMFTGGTIWILPFGQNTYVGIATLICRKRGGKGASCLGSNTPRPLEGEFPLVGVMLKTQRRSPQTNMLQALKGRSTNRSSPER